jgi:hypothetical protein
VDGFDGIEVKGGWRPSEPKGSAPGDYFHVKRPPRGVQAERRIQPYERLPMYHVATVGGDEQVDLFRDAEGNLKVHTRDEVFDLRELAGGGVTINIGTLGSLNILAKAGYTPGWETVIGAAYENAARSN